MGPLSGIKILDLSNVVSGPMAVQMLADQGAEVIKIEPPSGGDISRLAGAQRGGVSALYSVLNRNKRSVVLDLQYEEAKDILRRAREEKITTGKNPNSLAAAALYIAALKNNIKCAQNDISKTCQITEVTLRNRYKEFLRVLGIKISIK